MRASVARRRRSGSRSRAIAPTWVRLGTKEVPATVLLSSVGRLVANDGAGARPPFPRRISQLFHHSTHSDAIVARNRSPGAPNDAVFRRNSIARAAVLTAENGHIVSRGTSLFGAGRPRVCSQPWPGRRRARDGPGNGYGGLLTLQLWDNALPRAPCRTAVSPCVATLPAPSFYAALGGSHCSAPPAGTPSSARNYRHGPVAVDFGRDPRKLVPSLERALPPVPNLLFLRLLF